MATAAGTPAKTPTAPTSSPASGAGSSGADPTSKVALNRLTGTSSSSGTALTGDTSPAYDFQKHLEDAESKLFEGNSVMAQGMFIEILDRIEKAKLPENSLFRLHCFLGLAYSSASADRDDYFICSLNTVLKVYASRKDWREDNCSSAHSALRRLLKKLKPLIPTNQPAALTRTDEMIAECAKHILPIDAFSEMVKEADEAVKTKNSTIARALYEKALALIADKLLIEFEVARGICLLKLTRTYQKNELGRASVYNRAQEAIFSLFTKRASLYNTGKYTRVEAFKLLIGYLRDLRGLTPSDDVKKKFPAIQGKIEVCRPEIPEELSKNRAPASDPHQVTPGSPDGSWNLGRLFIAVVCIAALAVATVALYRRYSVKLN